MSDGRPRLVALDLRADADAWRAAGFGVDDDGVCRLGTTDLALSGATGDDGFAGWSLAGAIPPHGGLEGVPTTVARASDAVAPRHPNTVSAIDHVVLATPDTVRTFDALEAAGFHLRRVRDAGPELRQGFFLFADALLEVVGPPEPKPGTADDPAALWGLTLVAEDLDAAVAAFGPGRVGAPKDAVQAGRRIAVVDRSAALGTRVALMTPRT